MSINQLKTEVTEVSQQIEEVLARKEALISALRPYIDRYFEARVTGEKNPELRREFADLKKSKGFEIVDGTILRFTAKNHSWTISHDVAISELLKS
jgi:hypothetical protein